MGIENIFKSGAAHRDAMEKTRARKAMVDYVDKLSSAIEAITSLEALLSKPFVGELEGRTSSLTMQPIPDYHPEHCVRVVFDNKTCLPIGAELIESRQEQESA